MIRKNPFFKESKVLKESLVLKFIHIAETRDIYLNISNFTSVCPASVSMSRPVPTSEFHATWVLNYYLKYVAQKF